MKQKKYLKEIGLSKIENLGIDDQFIVSLIASKTVSLDGNEYCIIQIEILNTKDHLATHMDF
jgi:hypothetical protein